jgi:hypothetical protein
MSNVLVSGVAAALLMVTTVSPANAFRGGGFHDHDHFHERGFRGPGIVDGLALGLGLGVVGGALLYPPPVYYEPPPVCLAPPPLGYDCGPDGVLYPY